jgi:hypothetical protein
MQNLGVTLRHWQYRMRYEKSLTRALIDYESVFQEILNDLYESRARQPLSIDFGWTCDHDAYDAEANRSLLTGTRNVRLSIRWFSDFQDLANAIFRATDTFPGIGGAERNRFTFEQITQGADADQEQDISPDPLRHEAACVTVEIALAMIILHEIGHHALGHLDLRDAARFRFHEADAGLSELRPESVRRRQACEIAADRFSFSRVLRFAASGTSPFKTQLVSHELGAHLFTLSILAYMLVIALLHTKNFSLEEHDGLEHPHPAVRMLASQRALAEVLAANDDFENAYRRGWGESVRIIQHNADQRETFSLLLNRRSDLEHRIRDLVQVLETDVQKAVKRYDFRAGEWVAFDAG